MALTSDSYCQVPNTLQEAVVGSPWVRNEHRGRRSGGAGGVLRLGSRSSTSALVEPAVGAAMAAPAARTPTPASASRSTTPSTGTSTRYAAAAATASSGAGTTTTPPTWRNEEGMEFRVKGFSPRALRQDFTIEALLSRLWKARRTMAVANSDASSLVGGWSFRRDNLSRSLSHFVSLWDGDPTSIDRRNPEAPEIFVLPARRARGHGCGAARSRARRRSMDALTAGGLHIRSPAPARTASRSRASRAGASVVESALRACLNRTSPVVRSR